ncbi:MAG: 30S ribosomal protein S12 methylthiotransferase RimO [Lachnospiraceae bacterium]|nr:30S ribosomal protein S12 methylthiotransferase RimO [Lachnospiraceae bacterium]
MKVLFVSLGCEKNLADSEKMLGALKMRGHVLTDSEEEAEAAVVNTCCFIHDAKQESIETILSLAQLKETASLKYLIVMGCLAQRYKDEIIASIPETDAVLGTTAYDELADVLEKLEAGRLKAQERVIMKDISVDPVLPGSRVRSDITHYSYLKIAEGCDKRCTYCIIPDLKGHYRSMDFDALIAEAEALADDGVTELMIVAQETTLYGVDIYGKKRLPELLSRLCAIDGLKLIRLLYCYPEEITDELIETIASEPKICHYIDMPIQHASDPVLKRMGRRTNGAQIRKTIKKLRKAIPDIAIRTSLITGFPGETEEDHACLMSFLEECRLDRVGVFTYSREEDTPAYRMKDRVLKSVANRRRKELMGLQQKIVFEKNVALIGRELDVIIDGRIPEEGIYVGRTYMDAPGIDSVVFVHSGRDIISGSLIHVLIEDFKDYDLIGTEV